MDAVLILVVEDDAIQGMDLQDLLTDAGFQCVLATSGAEAISELDADAPRFHAIVTDIQIGHGPTGWDVARAVRILVPDMPMVYMSGDSANEWSANGVPNSIMISKPYAGAQITTALAGVINARVPVYLGGE
jgi:CheY-like chemotaxis protein